MYRVLKLDSARRLHDPDRFIDERFKSVPESCLVPRAWLRLVLWPGRRAGPSCGVIVTGIRPWISIIKRISTPQTHLSIAPSPRRVGSTTYPE